MNTRTVLVVDDEADLREMLAQVLPARGFRVLSAGSAAQALGVAQSLAAGALDLLITDLCLPGLNGAALAAELRQQQPGMAVIYASSFPVDEVRKMGVELPDVVFLAKPCSVQGIEHAVEAASNR